MAVYTSITTLLAQIDLSWIRCERTKPIHTQKGQRSFLNSATTASQREGKDYAYLFSLGTLRKFVRALESLPLGRINKFQDCPLRALKKVSTWVVVRSRISRWLPASKEKNCKVSKAPLWRTSGQRRKNCWEDLTGPVKRLSKQHEALLAHARK